MLTSCLILVNAGGFHFLVTFRDHWILDVLTTNWLGIYLGMKLCDYFEMKVYTVNLCRYIPFVGSAR